MKTGRLEAFSDGVLAIVITIMVLELQAPEDTTLEGLIKVLPIFISYVVSFIYIGIYWNNHHHLMQASQKVSGGVLWANLHLLFWLSLIPFATSWLGENHTEALPVALYGIILLMSAIAYRILELVLIKNHDENFVLKKITKQGKKENISILIYVAGIALAFVNPWLSIACFIIVAIFWVIPDKRIERILTN